MPRIIFYPFNRNHPQQWLLTLDNGVQRILDNESCLNYMIHSALEGLNDQNATLVSFAYESLNTVEEQLGYYFNQSRGYANYIREIKTSLYNFITRQEDSTSTSPTTRITPRFISIHERYAKAQTYHPHNCHAFCFCSNKPDQKHRGRDS